MNHLSRYRSRWRFFSELAGGDDAPDDFGAGIASGALPVLEALERADLRGALEQAVRALPDHQRVPLVLFHFEGTGYQEIADTLGVSLGKVKTDIHRGREALKRVLVNDDAIR